MRPTFAYIDTQAMLHNVSIIKQHAPNKKILAMIKSNAYGCGVDIIAPLLAKLPEIYGFGVASIDEAIQIRALGITIPILLCEGVFEFHEYELIAKYNLEFVIHSQYQIDWLLKSMLNKDCKIWLKINTGMNRLGVPIEKIANFLHELQAYNKPVLMTHLACADDPNHVNNIKQLEIIYNIYKKFPEYEWSLDNSSGIFNELSANMSIIRPGIALYGVSPYKNQTAQTLGLQPVMHLKAQIIATQHLSPGDKVGYGLTWQAVRPTTLAIVSIGYGDGYPRNIDHTAVVWVQGQPCPVVGKVSMDMITIDITDLTKAKIGDEVELWGIHVQIERIADSCGTIGYELLCHITPRVQKIKK